MSFQLKSNALWEELKDTFSLQMKQLCAVTIFIDELSSMSVIYRGLALSVSGPQCFQPGLLNLRNSFIPPFTCRLTPALLGWPVVNGTGCLFFLRRCLSPARLDPTRWKQYYCWCKTHTAAGLLHGGVCCSFLTSGGQNEMLITRIKLHNIFLLVERTWKSTVFITAPFASYFVYMYCEKYNTDNNI